MGEIGEGQKSDALLVRAVQAATDEEGRVFGSKLHQTMQRLDPSFDFRALGHSTFTKYLEASPAVKVKRPRGPGDVIVELGHSTLPSLEQPWESSVWDQELDRRWTEKLAGYGHSVPGPVAAMEAAKVIGVNRLKDSPHKTLQGLLESSEYLSARWSREGNLITKKTAA